MLHYSSICTKQIKRSFSENSIFYRKEELIFYPKEITESDLIVVTFCNFVITEEVILESPAELIDPLQTNVQLDSKQRKILEEKTLLIENEYITRTENARNLTQYLAEKRKEAQLAEEIEEDNLKRQGQKK